MIGGKWILSRNTGDNATPVWTTVKRVKNVNCPITKDMADMSRRESTWERKVGSLKKASLEVEYVYKNGTDADFAAFVDSFLNDTAVQLACTDIGIADDDAFGFSAWYECSECPLDQPLNEGVILKLKFELTDYEEDGVIVEPAFIGAGT